MRTYTEKQLEQISGAIITCFVNLHFLQEADSSGLFRQRIKNNKLGFQVPQQVKKGNTRKEWLDTWVYSYASMCFYISKFNRNTVWNQLEDKLNNADLYSKDESRKVRDIEKLYTKSDVFESVKEEFEAIASIVEQ